MKTKQSYLFIVFILGLTLAYAQVYSYVKYHYSGAELAIHEKNKLQNDLDDKILLISWYQNQLKDFQNQIVAQLPELKIEDPEKLYFARNLASVQSTQGNSSKLERPFSFALMKQAKEEFKDKKYKEASEILNEVIKTYPMSSYVVECHFLLAEIAYLQRNYAQSLSVIRTMMKLYPENELTGFIMIRMGQIYQMQHDNEQARVVYETINGQFQNTELKKQTEKLIAKINEDEISL